MIVCLGIMVCLLLIVFQIFSSIFYDIMVCRRDGMPLFEIIYIDISIYHRQFFFVMLA